MPFFTLERLIAVRGRTRGAGADATKVHPARQPTTVVHGNATRRIRRRGRMALPDEPDVTVYGAPENPIQIFHRPAVQGGEVGVAVGFGELTQAAAREVAAGGATTRKSSATDGDGLDR